MNKLGVAVIALGSAVVFSALASKPTDIQPVSANLSGQLVIADNTSPDTKAANNQPADQQSTATSPDQSNSDQSTADQSDPDQYPMDDDEDND